MLVSLAKLGSPEMVGQFALALAVTGPVVMFAGLQLRGVQATDVRREFEFSQYVNLRVLTTVLALLVIIGIAFGAGYRLETALVILVVGVGKSLDAVSDVFHGLFQQHEQMDRIAKSMMINGCLSVVLFGAGLIVTDSVVWGAVGSAIASALTLACYNLRSGLRILDGEMESRELERAGRAALFCSRASDPTAAGLLRLVKLTLPLGVVMLLVSLNSNVPRYFVERQLGESALGVFAALGYLMVASNTVVGSVGQAALPRLAKEYATRGVSAYSSLLLKLILIAAAGSVMSVGLVWVAGRELVSLVYTSEYATYQQELLLLTLAAGISSIASLLGYGMTAARRFGVQTPIFAGAVLTATASCAVLVPQYGLSGASFAVIFAAAFQLIGSAIVVSRAIRKGPIA